MPLQQICVTPYKPKETDNSGEEEHNSIPLNNEGLVASDSQSSSPISSGTEICRICHCDGETDGGFITPCYCSGSLRFVHQACLQEWIKCSGIKCCELCKFQFIMQSKTKPFFKWEPLEMTDFERKKLICTALFQVAAITSVGWTLFTLINATSEEMTEGVLEWAFWMKLMIIAIAFIGGVFFIYIQCKTYVQICQRWRSYNKVIYVQNVPEKQALDSEVSNSSESSTSECNLPKSRQSEENIGEVEDETIMIVGGGKDFFLTYDGEIYNEEWESEDSMVVLPPFLKLCRALGLT